MVKKTSISKENQHGKENHSQYLAPISKSLYRVWIHAVFSTKYRQSFITKEIKTLLYTCFHDKFDEMGCQLIIVNGLDDHVHCLFKLLPEKSLAEIIKHIKGSSSYHINSMKIMKEKFSWQRGYAAFSVSERNLNQIYRYIKNQ